MSNNNAVSQAGPRFLRLRLSQHLTDASLRQAISALGSSSFRTPKEALLVDCSAMDSYTKEARDEFVQWIRSNAPRLSRIAIVTNKPLWHMVIGGIALATRTMMKAFNSGAEAELWLLEGEAENGHSPRPPNKRANASP